MTTDLERAADNSARLALELAAAKAKLAGVRALLRKWSRGAGRSDCVPADELRDILEGE